MKHPICFLRTTMPRRKRFIIRPDTTCMLALCRSHGCSHWWSQRAVCCTATDGLAGSLGILPYSLLAMTPGQHHCMSQHTYLLQQTMRLPRLLREASEEELSTIPCMDGGPFSHRDQLPPCLSSASASRHRAVGWVARSHDRQQDRKCDLEAIEAEGSAFSVVFSVTTTYLIGHTLLFVRWAAWLRPGGVQPADNCEPCSARDRKMNCSRTAPRRKMRKSTMCRSKSF